MMQKIDYYIDYADVSDASDIHVIEKDNFSAPWSENQLREEIEKENCIFLAAKSNGMLLGYISGQLISDEFYISNIAVHSAYRKIGIGFELIKKLLSELSNLTCIFATLEVRVSNIAARNLYEKCGFELLGIRKGFYSKPLEDACIYTYYFNKDEVKIN